MIIFQKANENSTAQVETLYRHLITGLLLIKLNYWGRQ